MTVLRLPYSEAEIDRQCRQAPDLILSAVRSRRPEAVAFAMKSIERILEAKSAYEESENESVSR